MRASLTLLPLICILFATSTLGQTNQKSSAPVVKDLSSVVSGTGVTYLELIHKVLPDLTADPANSGAGIAHSTIPFRHLSEAGEPAALEGDLKLDSFDSRWINSEGKRVLLLELDITATEANQGTNYEGESVLLCAFQSQPQLKLIDLMDIKTDRFTSFWEKPAVLNLNAANDAFLVFSTHWNSGESYEDLNVLIMHDTKFKVLTNLFLLNTQGCGATFTETPVFRVLPAPARKYPGISVTVQVKKDADGRECDRRTPGFTKIFQAVYQWNASRDEYQTASRQLELLGKFNRDRM